MDSLTRMNMINGGADLTDYVSNLTSVKSLVRGQILSKGKAVDIFQKTSAINMALTIF